LANKKIIGISIALSSGNYEGVFNVTAGSNIIYSYYIDNLANGVQWGADLRCFIATAQGINLDSELYVYPVSGAWGMGTGKYLDVPITTNGVSWEWQTVQGNIRWDFNPTNPFVTASYSGSNRGGGTWYTGSGDGLDVVQTQTFTYHSDKDLKVTGVSCSFILTEAEITRIIQEALVFLKDKTKY
jgi:hypothetical protein